MTPEAILDRLDQLVARLEQLFDPAADETAVPADAIAFNWTSDLHGRRLQAVATPHRIQLDDLVGVDQQKQDLLRNTRQFLQDLPANNALLWGARGTGKSSLVKALLNELHVQGLRLVELGKQDLVDLHDIMTLLHGQPHKFILFCDDLSFETDDASYKALKSALDGSVSSQADNVLIYATSNRRHLMPEPMKDNLESYPMDGEIHFGDAIEEKISLSERFGLWLSFYSYNQDTYLDIVNHWLKHHGMSLDDDARLAALQWAQQRGARSGRSAWQFARDWAGRAQLKP
ncbi:MAG: ATP-binding protein [Chromatiales bacterium]|jgi:predicted AAA+ superfamily ATPase